MLQSPRPCVDDDDDDSVPLTGVDIFQMTLELSLNSLQAAIDSHWNVNGPRLVTYYTLDSCSWKHWNCILLFIFLPKCFNQYNCKNGLCSNL